MIRLQKDAVYLHTFGLLWLSLRRPLTGIICLLLIMTQWIVYPVENMPHSYQNNILNNICFIPSLYLHLPTTCAWGFSVKWHWHSLVEVIFSSHDLCWRNVNTRGLRTIYQGLDSEIEYSNTTHQCIIIFRSTIIWIYMSKLALTCS